MKEEIKVKWKEAIKKVIELLASNGWDLKNQSSKYDLLYEGKPFPPKEVYRLAIDEVSMSYPDLEIPTLKGGEQTNNFFRNLGYEVRFKTEQDPVKNIIEKYKERLRSNLQQNELYKWQAVKEFNGRPNLSAVDFTNEIKDIKFYNLIYGIGIGAVRHLASERPEKYRDCFKLLFDEKISLAERINLFSDKTLELYRELIHNEKLSHHHDERTIATLLTYYNANKYTFYKDSFYQKYCKLLGIKAKGKGQKYIHYLELIEQLKVQYISKDQELLELVKVFLSPDVFQDENHNILAQDILYSVLDGAVDEIDIENSEVYKISMGDFSESEIQECINKNIVIVHANTKAKGISTMTQGDYFMKMSIGDYFYLTHGNGHDKVKLLGKITSPPEPTSFLNYGEDGYLQRSIEIVAYSINQSAYRGVNKWWTPNNNSTCVPIKRKEIEEANKFIFTPYFKVKLISDSIEESMITQISTKDTTKMQKHPLNQILFGPPGTGKTYNTINKALEIIGVDISELERKSIKEEFDNKTKEGQIVFTTFHQSMSYEEFIEGIKPIEPEKEGDQVIYKVINGIFKKLCRDASTPNVKLFEESYNELLKSLTANENILELKTPTGKEFGISVNSKGNLNLHTGKDKVKQGTLTKENIQKQILGEEKFEGWEGYFKGVLNLLKSEFGFNPNLNKETKPYVLIIDEINRGNVSQIFGELITLIEEDKRIGKDEALEVTLPYSKDKFSVPSNLYIIGTMNTADRSVEALDTALRRRFVFEEMTPNPNLLEPALMLQRLWVKYAELEWNDPVWIEIENNFIKLHGAIIRDRVKYEALETEKHFSLLSDKFNEVIEFNGLNLKNLLNIINNRIEVLLDRDHQIGHSYFINVNSWDDLQLSFYKNIIPLLQEYFFGDYAKIGAVLGSGFVKNKHNDSINGKNLFAAFEGFEASDYDDKTVYEIVDYRNVDTQHEIKRWSNIIEMNFENAIKELMNTLNAEE